MADRINAGTDVAERARQANSRTEVTDCYAIHTDRSIDGTRLTASPPI